MKENDQNISRTSKMTKIQSCYIGHLKVLTVFFIDKEISRGIFVILKVLGGYFDHLRVSSGIWLDFIISRVI